MNIHVQLELIEKKQDLVGPNGPYLNFQVFRWVERPDCLIKHSWYSRFGTFDTQPLHSVSFFDGTSWRELDCGLRDETPYYLYHAMIEKALEKELCCIP